MCKRTGSTVCMNPMPPHTFYCGKLDALACVSNCVCWGTAFAGATLLLKLHCGAMRVLERHGCWITICVCWGELTKLHCWCNLDNGWRCVCCLLGQTKQTCWRDRLCVVSLHMRLLEQTLQTSLHVEPRLLEQYVCYNAAPLLELQLNPPTILATIESGV